MRLAALLLCGCGATAWPPEGLTVCQTPCGMTVLLGVDSHILCSDVQLMEPRLADVLAPTLPRACRSWHGVHAWERPADMSLLGKQWVGGYAECGLGRLVFHRGYATWRKPWHTALWHEMIHIAQGCAAPLPADPGQDEDHADWVRSDYYSVPRKMGFE